MAKKIRKIKAKIDKKEIERKISYSKYLLILLLAIIIVIALFVNLYPSQIQGSKSTGIIPPIVSGVIQTGGSCEQYSQCFIVACKGDGVSECINTYQMENYYKNCNNNIYNYTVNSDYSKCTCIQGNCRTP